MKNRTTLSMVAMYLVAAVSGTAFGLQTFDATMTADNAYAIYLGDPVSVRSLLSNATNLLASDIRSAESYSLTVPDTSYIYIASWSDDVIKHGMPADFTNLTIGGTILSGDPLWEVTATGLNLGNPDLPPTPAEMTTQIALANTGNNPSGGWVIKGYLR